MHSVKSTRGRPYSKELKALAQALAQRKLANDCNFHLVPFDSPSSSSQYRPTRHEKEREREITCALHQPRLKLLGFLSYTFEGNAETSHQCDTQCHRHIRPYIAASRFLTFCAAANGSFHRQLAKPAVKAAFRIQTDLVKMQVP